ncbi:MAG TPA: ComEC/Rec2 family competence protein [Acidimicrobiia bacterium]|nr:ComEC/Rec2 family competence protein [Acidimicrobiia bacterium]
MTAERFGASGANPLPPSVARAEAGAIFAAGTVLLGARVGEHLRWADELPAAVALIISLPAAAVLVSRMCGPRRWGGSAAGFLLLAAIGAVVMARAVSGLDGPAARLAAEEAEATVAVRLVADPQGRWTGVRVPVRLESVNGTTSRGTVLVAARPPAAERLRLLRAGESAVLTGRFRPLEGGERRWRWRHVAAVYEAGDLVGAGPARPALLRLANSLRHRVLAGGEALAPTDRALVAGFLVGDDRDLPPDVAADFRAAGLSHLLVVSGANVTLALALVAPLLQRFALVGRLVGGVAVLIVFCAMTRFEPSVLRAGAMSGVALLAAFLGRPVAGLRVLALAVGGLVVLDPFLVHSLGFGLSCGASAGILLLAAPLAGRLPGPRPVRESLAVTAAAQVGVAPIALPAFGGLPLAALPANLVAAPAAAALSLWGLASGLAGGVLAAGAGSAHHGPAAVLQLPTAALAGWIRAVAGLAARSPVEISAGPATVGLALGSVVWWRRSARAGRRRLLVGFSSGVALQAQQMVEGEQPGTGQEQSGGGHGVHEVEFEAAPAGGSEDADVPLDLAHDEQELHRGHSSPQAGEQPDREADPADEFNHDRGAGQ